MKDFIQVTGHDDGLEYIIALSTLMRVESTIHDDTPTRLTISDGAYRGGSFSLDIREALVTISRKIAAAQQ
jgi:hypothetical protein